MAWNSPAPRDSTAAEAPLVPQPPSAVVRTPNQLLSALPQDEYLRLAPHLVRVRLVRGQVLIERRQAADHVHFIESGLALLVANTTGLGPALQVAMIGREGAVGGLALLDATSAPRVGAVMQIAGTALRVPVAILVRIVSESPNVRAVMMRWVQALARQAMQVAAWNASDTVQQRCVRWLLMARERLDSDNIGITHESLSGILGVRRSSVTVAIRTLQRQGLARCTSRGCMTILDRSGLVALVDMGKPAGAAQPMESEDRER